MSEHNHLLFELGCEELPPKSLKKLGQSLLANTLEQLSEDGITFGKNTFFCTPRRLAILIEDVLSQQPDKLVEKRGPTIQAAFDAEGQPSKAALGFASSCGVAFDNLSRLETDKGTWLIHRQAVTGQKTIELIPEIINKSLTNLPIAKRMRWGNSDVEFARPVHWALLLFGNEPVKTHILGIETASHTFGHRFLSSNSIDIIDPMTYENLLAEQGKVIVDFEKRKNLIRQAADKTAQSVGGKAYIEEDLLEEIASLNEWPVPIIGNFNARFLELPMEVLITTMQSNQKYFPVLNEADKLLPFFITFSNIESKNPSSIQHGNERVILPRLSDAEFFWKQDRKVSLADRAKNLNSIVFQKDLGTLADKTQRVIAITSFISSQLGLDDTHCKRAAYLAKTDLITNMVGEFANLQGTMGRYYAAADNEHPDVALAIEEQYLPKQSGGATPSSITGQILALSEKVDTLCGIFSAGLIPTGDKDPYALRRSALGILRILIEKKLPIDIVSLCDYALSLFTHPFDVSGTRLKILDFLYDRLKGYCLDQGFSTYEYEAVLAVKPTEPLDFMQRLEAVRSFKNMPEAESLSAANKRIINILKKSDIPSLSTIGNLQEPAEKALQKAAENAANTINPLITDKAYTPALTALAALREPVDEFFTHVMVNTDDVALRNSRLALLQMLSNQFLKIADISKLQS